MEFGNVSSLKLSSRHEWGIHSDMYIPLTDTYVGKDVYHSWLSANSLCVQLAAALSHLLQ